MAITQTTTVLVMPGGRRVSGIRLSRAFATWMPLSVLVILLAAISIIQPSFLPGGGIRVLLVQAVPLILLACGQMLAILHGGIDLSNASTAVFSAIFVALLLPTLGPAAPIVTIAVAAGVGAIVGLLIGVFQVPSFAVTLGAMGVWQAAALIVSGSTTVSATGHLAPVDWLLSYRFLGLEVAVWLVAVIAVVLLLVVARTTLGQQLRAVGFNERSAILSGARRIGVRVFVYATSSALAAMAGIFLITQQEAASPNGAGAALLLPGIAAAILGGTLITGGFANPLNVLVGGLIVTLIPIGTAVIGVGPEVQSLVFGVLVIGAVVISIDRSRRGSVK